MLAFLGEDTAASDERAFSSSSQTHLDHPLVVSAVNLRLWARDIGPQETSGAAL